MTCLARRAFTSLLAELPVVQQHEAEAVPEHLPEPREVAVVGAIGHLVGVISTRQKRALLSIKPFLPRTIQRYLVHGALTRRLAPISCHSCCLNHLFDARVIGVGIHFSGVSTCGIDGVARPPELERFKTWNRICVWDDSLSLIVLRAEDGARVWLLKRKHVSSARRDFNGQLAKDFAASRPRVCSTVKYHKSVYIIFCLI